MGFDILLGNPPWERVKLQEKEWFATRSEEIATASNKAARQRLINDLEASDPPLHNAFFGARREAEGMSHFLRNSGKFPFCGRGDVNTYTVFSELFRDLIGPLGRSGCVVPTGIATDDTTKFFFQSIVEKRQLAALYDFENKSLFPGVHKSFKFCALTLSGSKAPIYEADFCFFAHHPDELHDEERRFTLSAEDIALVNPNTKTCPIFRTRRDAEITKSIYRRVPVLIDETKEDGNPWGVKFSAMFHMSGDSHLFHTREDLRADGWSLVGNIFERNDSRMLPLYEAKMIHHYDHQWATYEDGKKPRLFTEQEKHDPTCFILPRYWVAEHEVNKRLEKIGWKENWLMGWRDICRSTDERTLVNGIIPRAAVGDKFLLAFLRDSGLCCGFSAIWGSFACDFVARQKIGGTSFKYFTMRQIPVLAPDQLQKPTPWKVGESCASWIQSRAFKLHPFGESGVENSQVVHANERFELQAELHAAFFHLYGIQRDDVDYIMETFPIVKKKDLKEFGTYRTKERILEIFDEMATAIEHYGASSESVNFREDLK